jgi:hypothetical protein
LLALELFATLIFFWTRFFAISESLLGLEEALAFDCASLNLDAIVAPLSVHEKRCLVGFGLLLEGAVCDLAPLLLGAVEVEYLAEFWSLLTALASLAYNEFSDG